MRIRSIKPEFWRSDDIDALSIPDRLLFIGLWSYVDDSGIGLDKESSIAADLFAGDLAKDFSECSVRVHGGLKRLSEAGLITRYTANGKRYLHVARFDRHQRINRPTESRHPAPTSADAPDSEPLTEDSVSPPVDSPFGAGEQGSRGEETSRSAKAPRTTEDLDEGFDAFYAAYPKKKARGAALTAWRKACRKGVSADHVMTGLSAQIAAWRAEGTSPQYVPYPASWLNAESYDDDFGQVRLSLVPAVSSDPATGYADLRDRADAHAAGRLIGLTYIEPSQPMSDKTPSREWSRLRGVEFIDAHADEIRAALTERRTG